MAGSLLNWFRTRLSGFAPVIPDEEMTVKIVAAPPLRSRISSPGSPLATKTDNAPPLRTRITK